MSTIQPMPSLLWIASPPASKWRWHRLDRRHQPRPEGIGCWQQARPRDSGTSKPHPFAMSTHLMTFLPLRVTCLANGKSLRFVDDHLQPEDRAGLAVPNLSLREAWPTSPSAGFFGFHGLPRPYTPGSHLVLRLSGNRFEDFS